MYSLKVNNKTLQEAECVRNCIKETRMLLAHFSPMFQFYNPRKREKTKGFPTFSVGIEWEHW